MMTAVFVRRLLLLLTLVLCCAPSFAQQEAEPCPAEVDFSGFNARPPAAEPRPGTAAAPAEETQPALAPPTAQKPPASEPVLLLNCEGFPFEVRQAEPPAPPPPEVSREASLGRTAPEQKPALSQRAIIKAILGIVALMTLAYLGGHSKIQELERKLRIAHLVTTGLPFVALGLLASQPNIGILNPDVLNEIRPILLFGLGWIGFAVGFRFEAQLLGPLPSGTGSLAAATTLIPAAAIVAATGLLLLRAEGAFLSGMFVRDALILGSAGAITAISAAEMLNNNGSQPADVHRLWRVIHLEQLAGIVGLMLVGAFFRPQGELVAWQLPGAAWLFLTLGIGTMVGAVIYAVLGRVGSGPPFTVALLGSICFAAGMASFLRLSPLVVCFLAGLMLVNFPSDWKDRVRFELLRLERPIYFLFLIIAGALWRGTAWEGWALMAIFVAARIAGKWMGVSLFQQHRPGEILPQEGRTLIFGPVGALAIAMVVSAQDLYSGPTIPWIVTAVIGGAIVTEFIVQLTARGRTAEAPPRLEQVGY